jgi:hypothetical protein
MYLKKNQPTFGEILSLIGFCEYIDVVQSPNLFNQLNHSKQGFSTFCTRVPPNQKL